MSRRQSDLIRAGQTSFLLSLVKELEPPTRAAEKLLNAAVEIRQDPPDPADLAYLARELVQCTLPHSDPGQVPFWARTNGNLTLSMVSSYDP
jgi:hypothetical protein